MQAIASVPGDILVAGAASALLRYRFSTIDIDPPAKYPMPAIRSAYGIDIHPSTRVTAVSGAGGVELLSGYGVRLGVLQNSPAMSYEE
jgi:hypothetical protein